MSPDPKFAFLKTQFEKDRLAQYLGIEMVDYGEGFAVVRMVIKECHLNSIATAHGGSYFTLADFAMAIASNAYGPISVALNANMTFMKAAREGDVLTASARVVSKTRRTATIIIEVANQQGELMALMQGVVYRKSELLPGAPDNTETVH